MCPYLPPLLGATAVFFSKLYLKKAALCQSALSFLGGYIRTIFACAPISGDLCSFASPLRIPRCFFKKNLTNWLQLFECGHLCALTAGRLRRFSIDLLGLDVLMRDPVHTAAAMTYHPFQNNRQGALPLAAFLSSAQPSFSPAVAFPEVASVSEPLQEQAAFDARLQPGQQRSSKSLEPEDKPENEPNVTLESRNLWNQFHKMGTEMVITKSGR